MLGEPVIQSWLEAALDREAHGEVQVFDQLLSWRWLLMCNGEFPCYRDPLLQFMLATLMQQAYHPDGFVGIENLPTIIQRFR